ncbi:MAG: DUF3858 domain-containing protein, partial [Planctomycetes bacterium]|nr:DUF3858 domain-containing protein [Planctomycetota bacterium]
LKEAGIEAYPVLIRADNFRSKEDLTLPMVSHFNHVISFIPEIDGEEANLFLDGTAQFHPMHALPDMDRGAEVFVVRNGAFEMMTIPYSAASDNQQVLAFEVDVHENGSALVSLDALFHGTQEAQVRKTFLNPGKRNDNLEETFGSLFGDVTIQEAHFTDVENLDLPMRYDALVEVSDFLLERTGGMQLRSVFFSSDLGRLASEDERKFDLLLGVPHRLSSALIYRLPENFSVTALPADTELENDFVAYSLSYKRDEMNTIRIQRDLTIKAARIAAADYKVFRDLCREADRAENIMIQLLKTSRDGQ